MSQTQLAEKNKSLLLDVEELSTHFFTEEGIVRAVDRVSLRLSEGDTLGIVGESGCGKSVTALSILSLIPDPPGKIVGGKITLTGRGDLTKLTEAEMRKIRGNEISMIFQEPMTSLNPVIRVGSQIAEAISLHQSVTKRNALEQAIEMLKLVGISSPERRAKDYPHLLSGGMRQRVMIAMALCCKPKLLIADEPTTALDVTIQAQILELMNKLKQEVGTSIILITHNMGVVAKMAQKVCVMYAGVVVESADMPVLFSDPIHPYTLGLLKSIPRKKRAGQKTRLHTIPGVVPGLLNLPKGCRFSDRCYRVHEPCRRWEPPLAPPENRPHNGQHVRCWLYLTPPKE